MTDAVADAFGALLAASRHQAGLSQEELAYRSSLDRTAISQLERGVTAPRLETVIRLAGALGLEPARLLPSLRWDPPSDTPVPRGRFVED